MHHGVPDVGLLTTAEMAEQVARICAAVDIPVIVDGDELGGHVAAVARGLTLLERAGAAGLHIEDEQVPKHSAWRGGLVEVVEMQERIAAAVAARHDPDLVVIARCNELQNRAWYGEGAGTMGEMLRRATAYAEAGADLFLANGATPDEIDKIVGAVSVPVAAYRLPRDEAARRGVSLSIFSGWAAAAAVEAHRQRVRMLFEDGDLPREPAAWSAGFGELADESAFDAIVRGWAVRTGRSTTEGVPGPRSTSSGAPTEQKVGMAR